MFNAERNRSLRLLLILSAALWCSSATLSGTLAAFTYGTQPMAAARSA